MIMRTGKKLGWLVAVHLGLLLVFMLVFSGLVDVNHSTRPSVQDMLLVSFVALIFAQLGLLAFGAAFSPVGWWKRWGGLAVAVACLEVLIDLALDLELFLMPCVFTALIAGSLLVMQRLGIRLRVLPDLASVPEAESDRLRFSIRELMILTAVVALPIAGARKLQIQTAPDYSDLSLTIRWSSCFLVVALLTLRTGLGVTHPLKWGLVLGVLSPALGLLIAHAADANPNGYIDISLIMVLCAAILLSSLLVVRSCGFRLVKWSVPGSSPPTD
jgi:hypothetical protein